MGEDLEGQLTVVIGEVSELIHRGGCGVTATGRGIAAAVGGGGIAVAAASRGVVVTAAAGLGGISAIVIVTTRVGEIDVAGHHFGGGAAVAVPVSVLAVLEGTLDQSQTALGEEAGDELTGLSPGDYIEEIGFPLAGLPVLKVPVYGQTEGSHGHTALGVTQLRIGHQPALKEDLVQQAETLLTRPYR